MTVRRARTYYPERAWRLVGLKPCIVRGERATVPRKRRSATGAYARMHGPAVTPTAAAEWRSVRPPRAVVSFFRPRREQSDADWRGIGVGDWRALEAKLPYRFKDRELLRQALVHTSFLNENPGIGVGSNERLEFLGDAALGLVVALQLYRDYPDVDEGRLTELRAHIVRRDTLARAAARLDLGEHLQLGRGEDAAGGRRRPTNLARAYEAVVGAVFLDGGFRSARAFIRKSLKEEFTALQKKGMPYDPKSRLQELIQSRWQTTPAYRLVKTEGPDHARRFTVQVVVSGRSLGTGEGRSKQMAEKEAAKQALDAMEAQESA